MHHVNYTILSNHMSLSVLGILIEMNSVLYCNISLPLCEYEMH